MKNTLQSLSKRYTKRSEGKKRRKKLLSTELIKMYISKAVTSTTFGSKAAVNDSGRDRMESVARKGVHPGKLQMLTVFRNL